MRKQTVPKSMNIDNSSWRSSQISGALRIPYKALLPPWAAYCPQDSSKCGCPAGAMESSGAAVRSGLGGRPLEDATGEPERELHICILHSGFIYFSKNIYRCRKLLPVSPVCVFCIFQNLPKIVRGTAFQLHITLQTFKNRPRSCSSIGEGGALPLGKARLIWGRPKLA